MNNIDSIVPALIKDKFILGLLTGFFIGCMLMTFHFINTTKAVIDVIEKIKEKTPDLEL